MSLADRHAGHDGFTLIEVLVTLLIIAIGLLGLASLQVNTLKNQLEAYQRTQAVLLAEDMVNRIRANAIAARGDEYSYIASYGVGDPNDSCPADPNTATTAANDMCAWNTALVGSDVLLDGTNSGSITGARGCLADIAGSSWGEKVIRVTVAWAGNSATAAPASTCGQDAYGDDDRFRRVVSIDAVLANLDPNSV